MLSVNELLDTAKGEPKNLNDDEIFLAIYLRVINGTEFLEVTDSSWALYS